MTKTLQLHLLYICTLLLSHQLILAGAQFGIKKKAPKNDILIDGDAAADTAIDNGGIIDDIDIDDLIDFENDPELQEAIQQFADLSQDEMVQTIYEMKELLSDDPDSLAELDIIIDELSRMSESEIQQNLEAMLEEEAVAQSIGETLEMLQNADESVFENTILGQKDEILKNIVESGIMSKEELEIFEQDGEAWEKELRFIWNELRLQASEAADGSASTSGASSLLNDEL